MIHTPTAELFRKMVEETPDHIKIQVNLSFDIADKIANELVHQNMTQKDFAHKMHKSEAEVSRWLSGTHNFTLSTIAKISAVLGCNIIQTA